MKTKIFSLAICFSVFAASACKDGPNDTKWQYLPDMADAPTVKAQENYLEAPEGSVAINAILYPKTIEESEKLLRNPLARLSGKALDARVDQGKKLFATFCQHCHGQDAKGVGTVTDKFVPAPDITTGTYKSKKDGFFFHKITFGGPIMPGLGHAISAHERWKIVLYLRQLQNGGQN
jgi:mono/diheme cytochrome c family protein